MNYKYTKVGLGGTFDHLHRGHKKLLIQAFKLSQQVVIGVTTNEFITHKQLPTAIASYTRRVAALEYFLSIQGFDDRYEITPLTDVYGPTLTDSNIEAVVVSTDTLEGARLINAKRLSLNLRPLAIEVISLVDDTSNIPISSTRIRQGFTNSDGEVFAQIFSSDLKITSTQRDQLKQPLGQILSVSQIQEFINQYQPITIAVVGDQTLKTFLATDINFNYGVFDGKTNRDTYLTIDLPDWTRYSAMNKNGTISHQAADEVRKLLTNEKALLNIEGEEDLLTLVFVLLLPLKSLVFYGQPDEGVVAIEVNESNKDQWYRFLNMADKIDL